MLSLCLHWEIINGFKHRELCDTRACWPGLSSRAASCLGFTYPPCPAEQGLDILVHPVDMPWAPEGAGGDWGTAGAPLLPLSMGGAFGPHAKDSTSAKVPLMLPITSSG